MLCHILFRMVVLSAGLFLLIVVTHEVILPVEQAFRPVPVQTGAVFYLPLGYWVIVAYYERWRAALYLAPGIASGLAVYGHPDPTFGVELLRCLVMALTAPLAFAILSWSLGRANEPVSDPHAWRLIVAAGAVTAVLNGLALNIIQSAVLPGAATIATVLEASASGFVGLIGFLALLSFAFRLQAQVQQGR